MNTFVKQMEIDAKVEMELRFMLVEALIDRRLMQLKSKVIFKDKDLSDKMYHHNVRPAVEVLKTYCTTYDYRRHLRSALKRSRNMLKETIKRLYYV